jgi:hypothetical protein
MTTLGCGRTIVSPGEASARAPLSPTLWTIRERFVEDEFTPLSMVEQDRADG